MGQGGLGGRGGGGRRGHLCVKQCLNEISGLGASSTHTGATALLALTACTLCLSTAEFLYIDFKF